MTVPTTLWIPASAGNDGHDASLWILDQVQNDGLGRASMTGPIAAPVRIAEIMARDWSLSNWSFDYGPLVTQGCFRGSPTACSSAVM